VSSLNERSRRVLQFPDCNDDEVHPDALEVEVVQTDGEQLSAKLSRKEAKRDDWMGPSAFQS
jgi:hypothetical protein